MSVTSDIIGRTGLQNKFKSLKKGQILKLIAVIVCVILGILGYIVYTYLSPDIKQILFFKKKLPTDNEYVITKDKLNRKKGGKEYSFSLWLRINNWYNNDKNEKNIFSFGAVDKQGQHENVVPSVWLDGRKNNIHIYVHTKKGVNKTPIKVENVPVKKWFKLTVVLTSNSVQVFLNSKLDVFTYLEGNIINPNGDLHLFTGEHKIDGQFANVVFYNQALMANEVAKLYQVGDKPIDKSMLYKLVQFFKNVGSYKHDKELVNKKKKSITK